jgi:hypothetical protein
MQLSGTEFQHRMWHTMRKLCIPGEESNERGACRAGIGRIKGKIARSLFGLIVLDVPVLVDSAWLHANDSHSGKQLIRFVE